MKFASNRKYIDTAKEVLIESCNGFSIYCGVYPGMLIEDENGYPEFGFSIYAKGFNEPLVVMNRITLAKTLKTQTEKGRWEEQPTCFISMFRNNTGFYISLMPYTFRRNGDFLCNDFYLSFTEWESFDYLLKYVEPYCSGFDVYKSDWFASVMGKIK